MAEGKEEKEETGSSSGESAIKAAEASGDRDAAALEGDDSSAVDFQGICARAIFETVAPMVVACDEKMMSLAKSQNRLGEDICPYDCT